MNVTVRMPDDFAERLGSGDLGRRALEALALQEHRACRLTLADLRQVLDFATQAQPGAFERPWRHPTHHGPSAGERLCCRIRAFTAGKTLGGLDPVAPSREGRR